MKTSKTRVFVGMVISLGCLFASLVVMRRHVAQHLMVHQAKAELPTPPDLAKNQSQNKAPPTQDQAMPERLALPEKTTQAEPTFPSPAKTDALNKVKAPPIANAPKAATATTVSADKDPLAREALSLVGADPVAEAYWLEAINDARLSAEERQNLIEDLNEDGLTDAKHPTVDDLPLIINRLLLIEDLAPDAVDKVSFDAFQEAYKDLLNLAEVAMGGGEPVN